MTRLGALIGLVLAAVLLNSVMVLGATLADPMGSLDRGAAAWEVDRDKAVALVSSLAGAVLWWVLDSRLVFLDRNRWWALPIAGLGVASLTAGGSAVAAWAWIPFVASVAVLMVSSPGAREKNAAP